MGGSKTLEGRWRSVSVVQAEEFVEQGGSTSPVPEDKQRWSDELSLRNLATKNRVLKQPHQIGEGHKGRHARCDVQS